MSLLKSLEKKAKRILSGILRFFFEQPAREPDLPVNKILFIRYGGIGDMILSFPVETDVESSYAQNIENGESWETLATVSINEPGSYSVIFELWIYDETGALEFSYNYCVLPIEVVE